MARRTPDPGQTCPENTTVKVPLDDDAVDEAPLLDMAEPCLARPSGRALRASRALSSPHSLRGSNPSPSPRQPHTLRAPREPRTAGSGGCTLNPGKSK
jgi:hypothetical protein